MCRQEPRAPARCASLGRALGLRHHDVRRQIFAFGPQAVGDPAPQAGEAHDHPPGIHLVHGRGVDHAVGVARANQCDIIGVRVEMRDEVGHVHPRLSELAPLAVAAQAKRVGFEELAVNLAEAGRQRLRVEAVQKRLGVEQVHLAGTAGHEQENTALGLRRQMAGLRGQWPAAGPGEALTAQQVRKAQQPKAAAGGFEEFTTAARQERLRAGAAVRAGLGHAWGPS